MFIHWSVDVQLGTIISHNAAASSADYQDRYFNELQKYYKPKNFDPDEWAKLAKLAGMKYMIFTAKHHNGFCMWDTETVDFKITNTPYGNDIMKEILDAFRKYEIPVGFCYSPDDFYLNYIQGIPPSRNLPEANPDQNKEMWEIEKEQIRELLTNYGKIDFFFIDEYYDFANTLVADYCWELDPDLIITRGGMETPGQKIPNKPMPGPWEVCFTIGRHWGYVAEEPVKDGSEIINMLVETRAKGGNLLLNVSPDSHGIIPSEQEARLRETALWMMANREAVLDIKPFKVINEHISSNWHYEEPEHYIWFTKSKNDNVVYAIVPAKNWGVGGYKTFFIRSLKGNADTKVSVLGQQETVMEYKLKTTGRPVVAVAAINIMEDSPLFNAGKGAVFTNEGKNELDASIMDGSNLQAGAVASITTVKNPINAALAVMLHSPHVMLVGAGADEFAAEQGLEIVEPSYFHTERRMKQLERLQQKETSKTDFHKWGTVGAVALDKYGNLAAATSTGGMTNKQYGRVGDSPIIGAGTYAENESCAVSATGQGEYFIRGMISYEVAALMKYKNLTLQDAANFAIHEKLTQMGGEGGIISLDAAGNIAVEFNTRGMFRAWKKAGEKAEVYFYTD